MHDGGGGGPPAPDRKAAGAGDGPDAEACPDRGPADDDRTHPHDATAIVLAGGGSRRMGRDKAFLTVGGRTMLDRALAAAAVCRETLVVVPARERERYGRALKAGRRSSGRRSAGSFPARRASTGGRLGGPVRVIADFPRGRGPMAGIVAGLRTARTPLAWVLACDLPLVPPALGGRLLEQLTSDGEAWDAAVPRGDGRRQPLCAAYRRESAAEAARACLDEGAEAVFEWLDRLRVRILEEPELADLGEPRRLLLNVNRPGHLARARKAWADDAAGGRSGSGI